MKYGKILGLAAMALAALMAFAGTASATILTSPAGTTYTGVITMESEGSIEMIGELGTFGTIRCKKSTVKWKVESHGANVTAAGKIAPPAENGLTLTECEGGPVTSPVAQPGVLEIHTDTSIADGNGVVTSKEAKVVAHNTVVGTCTFETGTGTNIGTVTGGTPAKLAINGAVIRVSGSNPFCGSTSVWKGTYKFTTPSTLLVD